MDRTITYHIDSASAGLRIEQFLRRRGYSYQNLTQLKKMPQSILVNGDWTYMRTVLSANDTLTVRIQEHGSSPNIPPVKLPLDIIYEDEDIIVVNKPAGMPVHPSLNNYRNSLANALMYYYQAQGLPFIFRCTNRLDRDTSGLTVIAKHLVSSSILSALAVKHEITREYLAIVRGTPAPPAGTINAPIGRTGSSLIERKVDFENGEHATLPGAGYKKRAQPRLPHPGDGPHPSDPCPYEIYRLSADRRLSLQSRHGAYKPPGASLIPARIPPSGHRGTAGVYRAAAGGHAPCSWNLTPRRRHSRCTLTLSRTATRSASSPPATRRVRIQPLLR